jgi:hypothetical protein
LKRVVEHSGTAQLEGREWGPKIIRCDDHGPALNPESGKPWERMTEEEPLAGA